MGLVNTILLVVFALIAAGAATLYFKQLKRSAALENELADARQAAEDAARDKPSPVADTASAAEATKSDFNPNNRSSDSLFATLSHELRTPLNGVLGIVQMMNETKDDPNLIALEGCARQMRSVVHTLVNLSKIKAEWGDLPQYREWVSVYALLEQVKKDLAHRAATRGLKIVVAHEDTMLRLRCDMDHLDTIIETALLGSIESVDLSALPEGSKDLFVQWEADADRVQVTIVNPLERMPLNRGARIAAIMNSEESEAHERIKMQFLYWAVSNALLEHYDGAMMASEMEGGGVRTVLAFKMEQMRASPTTEKPVGGLGLQVGDQASKALIELPESLHVLVAEDDPINRELMKNLLERMNQKPTFAKNGQELLEIVAEDQSFDLILMDIDMPVLDGISTAYSLRAGEADEYGMNIPIVALTAFNTLSDQSKFKKAGMDYFLPKPVGIRELRDVFIDVMRKETA